VGFTILVVFIGPRVSRRSNTCYILSLCIYIHGKLDPFTCFGISSYLGTFK